MAKYDPTRDPREQALLAAPEVISSDVFRDYDWRHPRRALREPWMLDQCLDTKGKLVPGKPDVLGRQLGASGGRRDQFRQFGCRTLPGIEAP